MSHVKNLKERRGIFTLVKPTLRCQISEAIAGLKLSKRLIYKLISSKAVYDGKFTLRFFLVKEGIKSEPVRQ